MLSSPIEVKYGVHKAIKQLMGHEFVTTFNVLGLADRRQGGVDLELFEAVEFLDLVDRGEVTTVFLKIAVPNNIYTGDIHHLVQLKAALLVVVLAQKRKSFGNTTSHIGHMVVRNTVAPRIEDNTHKLALPFCRAFNRGTKGSDNILREAGSWSSLTTGFPKRQRKVHSFCCVSLSIASARRNGNSTEPSTTELCHSTTLPNLNLSII